MSAAPEASILDLLQSRGGVGGGGMTTGGGYILAHFQSNGHEAGLRGSWEFPFTPNPSALH